MSTAPPPPPTPAPEIRGDTTHVVKLEESNYRLWKLQISAVLDNLDLMEIVDGTLCKPAASDVTGLASWIKKDKRAKALIIPTVGLDQADYIAEAKSSREIWSLLKDLNSDTSQLNVNHTLSKYLNYKMQSDQSLLAAFLDLQRLGQTLNDMGHPVSETMTITKIVDALPQSLAPFKTAWASVSPSDQTMANLRARLRHEQTVLDAETAITAGVKAMAFAAGGHRPRQDPANIAEQKRQSNCNNCGKRGHWAKECRGPRRDNGRRQDDRRQDGRRQDDRRHGGRRQDTRRHDRRQEEHPHDRHWSPRRRDDERRPHAFMVLQNNDEKDVWFSDSGASDHYVGDKKWFCDYTEFATPQNVTNASNQFMEIRGSGTVRLLALIEGQWEESTIANVLYSPGAVNLFSEGVMAQKGFLIQRDSSRAVFIDAEGRHALTAVYCKGMYVMQFQEMQRHATLCKAQLWHERCSHINMKYLQKTVKLGAVTGIDYTELTQKFSCEDCHLGKETRKPFPAKEERRNTVPGEMIHFDLSGKMRVPSVGRNEYFLLLKDDATGFKAVYFQQAKTETEKNIKNFIAFLETQTGNRVKRCLSDNGTECRSLDFISYCHERGIKHDVTVPRNPEMNGCVEREMRTIKNAARCMLLKNQLPEFLWADAVATTVFIQNRLLSKRSPEVTPYEQIFGDRPNLKSLHVFGCKAFMHNSDPKRGNWDARSKKVIFVGYAGDPTIYRLFEPTTKKVFIERNVSFVEMDKGADLHIPCSMIPDTPEEKVGVIAPQPDTDADDDSYIEELEPSEATPVLSPSMSSSRPQFVIETARGSILMPSSSPDTPQVIHLGRTGPVLRERANLKRPDRFANAVLPNEVPDSYKQAIKSSACSEWKRAMDEEMQSHQSNGTWELVEKPDDAHLLDSRWVYRIKFQPNGSIDRYKARLCLKGFRQRAGIDFFDTFASVCRYETIRCLLALVSSQRLNMLQFDVSVAFLNGDLHETLYMRQPEGYENGNPNIVCLLKKSLYGAKQAPKCWSEKINASLKAIGLNPSESDPCLFLGAIAGDPIWLLLYVDDGLCVAKKSQSIDFVLAHLKSQFELKVNNPNIFIGLQLEFTYEGIVLHQRKYIGDLLARFQMNDCKPSTLPIQSGLDFLQKGDEPTCDQSIPFRQLIGALLFIVRTSRPDVAFAVCKLAQFSHCYQDHHFQYAKGILRYLKGTASLGLLFRFDYPAILQGFTDSDYAGDRIDRKSTSGFVFFIGPCLVTWQSKKQTVTALSSTEAEYISLGEGVKEALWLRRLCADLGVAQEGPTSVRVDNQSTIRLAENPTFHNRTKHVEIKFHFVRDLVAKGHISVDYVPTTEQAADACTKALPKVTLSRMKILWNMLTLLLCLAGSNGFSMVNTAPVLWKKLDVPVSNGFHEVNLKLHLVSPCTLLTDNVIHRHLLPAAIAKCEEVYITQFLDPLSVMCPSHKWDIVEHRHRRRRAIPLIIGAIYLGYFVVGGLGISGAITGGISLARSSATQSRINEMEVAHAKDSAALAQIQSKFNKVVNVLQNVTEDFTELKEKSISSHFAISYIMGKLIEGRSTLLESRRQWDEGKVHAGLFDYFNITLPCGKSCPLKFAKPIKCQLSAEKDKLFFDFTVTSINPNLTVVRADAFNLMKRDVTTNQTCTVRYTGPSTTVISPADNCITSIDAADAVTREVIMVPPTSGCKGKVDDREGSSYFQVNHCHGFHLNDHKDFIQIKPATDGFHIYCPLSTLTINGKSEPCPDSVFLLPLINFQINDDSFFGSQINVHHQQTYDPSLTALANWIYRPTVNWSSLLVNETLPIEGRSAAVASAHDWLGAATMAGCVVIIILLVGALVHVIRRNKLLATVTVRTTAGTAATVDVIPPPAI